MDWKFQGTRVEASLQMLRDVMLRWCRRDLTRVLCLLLGISYPFWRKFNRNGGVRKYLDLVDYV